MKYGFPEDREQGPFDVLWPDPGRGTWGIRFLWDDDGDKIDAVGVAIRSMAEPPRALGTTTMRSIPLATLVDAEKRRLHQMEQDLVAEAWREASGMEDDGSSTQIEPLATHSAERLGLNRSPVPVRAGRPPKYGPEQLRRVAKIYRAAAPGYRSTPTLAVAEALGVTRAAAAKIVARARDAGLIEPTDRGRPRRNA